MNISTGGPHILLFERDQQLTALLMSEFQLAGYELHAARTAVEVFDAIARFPIRLVLVDLAQAAAARREFWVALDTQRRGRGVQVFTFTCTNIAGYGPADAEERSQTTLADMQIDGMLGVMSLVDAVRARVPGMGATTNTMPRLPRSTTMPAPPPVTPPVSAQNSSAFPQLSGNTSSATSGTAYRAGTQGNQQTAPLPPAVPAARANQPIAPQPPMQTPTASHPSLSALPPSPATEMANVSQQSYTDKIRAVLYPGQRSWNGSAASPPVQETNRQTTYDVQSTPAPPPAPPTSRTTSPITDDSMLQRLANGQAGIEQESGLAQLSRLVQGFQPSHTEETSNSASVPSYTPPAPRPIQANDAIGTPTLRASPIEDLPIGRGHIGNEEGTRHGEPQVPYGQAAVVTPLASISMPLPPAPASVAPVAPTRPIPVPDVVSSAPTQTRQASAPETPIPAKVQTPVEVAPEPLMVAIAPQPRIEKEEVETDDDPTRPFFDEEEDDEVEESRMVQRESVSARRQEERSMREEPEQSVLPNNALLLDIVQSLPPMPAPLPQPQALQGRATRSLGSILLEGHLVPQNRLEVAQNIQRMLRGVDLNYQLGEILLMFKLLTPDQLLAASLVSYGLITTQQIVALGRIRQELHSIGLEYDLENLLILFRILTSEQLREVRSSWQS